MFIGASRVCISAIALGAFSLAACSVPLPASAPAENTPIPQAGEIRQVRGVVPSPTVPTSAPRTESLAPGAPLPTPLSATATPVAPDVSTLDAPPAGRTGVQLDGPSAAAATASAATAVARVQRAAATAAALPTREIIMQDLAFSPATMTVRAGTKVVWLNRDRVMHQVQGGKFDSGHMPAGQYWASLMETPGRHAFVCSFHPTMRAEIIVTPDDSRPIHLGS